MRFSELSRGKAAERKVSFTYAGKKVEVLLRPLTYSEEIDIIAKAVKLAQGSGVREPKGGDPIYEAHVQAETLALSCLDPDSPTDNRATTFASASEVLDMDHESVTLLFEQQAMWQEECSPSIHSMSTRDLFKNLEEVCERADPFDYFRFSQRTRWQLQLFTGALLVSSPGYKLWHSLLSEDTAFEPAQLVVKIREAMTKVMEAGKADEGKIP